MIQSELPQSNALSEVSPTSIQELWALDPERWSEKDLELTISEIRKLRERLREAEIAGKPTRNVRIKNPTLPLPSPQPQLVDIDVNLEEFGI